MKPKDVEDAITILEIVATSRLSDDSLSPIFTFDVTPLIGASQAAETLAHYAAMLTDLDKADPDGHALMYTEAACRVRDGWRLP